MDDNNARMSNDEAELVARQQRIANAAPTIYATLKVIFDRDFTYLDGCVMSGQISVSHVRAAREVISKIEGRHQ